MCGLRKVAIVLRVDWPLTVKKRKKSRWGRDKRRKHRHWQVTVYYHDGEKFARVYTDREKASRFAERQKKSPVVRATRILEVD